MFRPFLLVLIVSGCASQQAASKMSFSEIYTPRPQRPPPEPKRPPTQGVVARPNTATRSPELQAALVGFAARARSNRSSVARGSAMPFAQAENWRELVSAVDGFLLRSAEETSSYDVIRAHVTIEAELDLDARRYGAVDDELAQLLLERVNRLGLRMAELRRLKVRTQDRRIAFGWPVSPVAVTSLYGRRLHPVTLRYRQHSGIDLAAELGQLVSVSAPGVVLRAGYVGGYGNLVEVQHANGVITRYGHLSQILTETGSALKQGDPIGLAGNTGVSTGVHLHFEVWKDGKPVDPLEQLGQPEEHHTPLAVR